VLVGFALMLVFGIHDKLIASGLLTQVSAGDSSEIIKLMLRYGFQLGLCVTILGFGLAYIEKVHPVDAKKLAEKLAEPPQGQVFDAGKLAEELLAPLQGQILAKEAQVKALTEAITALSKADAPAKSINAALRELEQGDTAKKAQAIFAEVLRSKEAEGRQANKEAAAAARHLGALTFEGDTKEALAAYQKAVALAPDNVDGWNRLATLFLHTGQLTQAEAAYRKVLALGNSRQDRETQAVAYGNLGIVYSTRGELGKAEEMHRKALAINEALGSKEGMANQYADLGIVAYTRGELDKAEEMHRKALELGEALSSKEGTAINYANLGIVYKKRGELDNAEELWKKSLRLFQEMGHPTAKQVQQWLDELVQHRASQPAPPAASPRR